MIYVNEVLIIQDRNDEEIQRFLKKDECRRKKIQFKMEMRNIENIF